VSETPWTVVAPLRPRFRDTDAMGHINNAVYVTYLEVANPGTGVGNLSATPSATSLTTISGGTITSVGDFYQKSTDTFTITPGAAVFVNLTRAGTDGYSYELDILQPTLVISGS